MFAFGVKKFTEKTISNHSRMGVVAQGDSSFLVMPAVSSSSPASAFDSDYTNRRPVGQQAMVHILVSLARHKGDLDGITGS